MSQSADWTQEFFSGLWLDAQRQMWSDDDSEHDAEACAAFLDLAPGASVLDVPCGDGRIAVRLAANGFSVTGVDRDPGLLADARALAARVEVQATFDEADMRRLAYRDAFHGALCMWGSLGYGSEEQDREFLAGVARALRPGGVFLIDTHVTETLLPNFTDATWHQAGDVVVAEHREYDVHTGRVQSEWLLTRGDQAERRHSSIRIYAYRELCNLLESCGFVDFDGRGSTQLEPFAMGAPRLFLRAVLPG